MEDCDVDMDEEEDGEVYMRKATTGHWFKDCGVDGNCVMRQPIGVRGYMVNSHSWTEELQDIFAQQAEDSGQCYSRGRTRLSSISVSLSHSV